MKAASVAMRSELEFPFWALGRILRLIVGSGAEVDMTNARLDSGVDNRIVLALIKGAPWAAK